MNNPDLYLPSIESIEMELATRSLHDFTKYTWNCVEPNKFVDGRHIHVISEHLEACLSGDIRKLIINIPPRHCKSLLTATFFPGFSWLKNPEKSFLFTSYASTLSIRDSRKCRLLVQNEKYKNLIKVNYPEFRLTGDQNTKIRFENNYKGYRIATSIDGVGTGEGADFVVTDDPHSTKEGESEAKRTGAILYFDETLSTRLNDPDTGVFIIIMQRVHEKDLTGHILAEKTGWNHLCLPARYENESKSKTFLNFVDWRKEHGEPLWKERFGDKQLRELELSLGSYASSMQLQQRAAPREGGMFKIDKIEIVEKINPALIVKQVRFWDKAATQGDGCFSAGVKMAIMQNGDIIVLNVVKGKWSTFQRENIMKQTADIDGKKVPIYTEQEPGSGGVDSAKMTIRNLIGYNIRAIRPTGDKVTRAQPFSAQVEAGFVKLVKGSWNSDYLSELQMFPNSEYKDQVDASSGAFSKLTLKKKAGAF